MRPTTSLLFLSAVLGLASPVPAGAVGGDFVLAKDGRPAAPLVLLPGSGTVAEAAMADFAGVLGRMSGGKFERRSALGEGPVVVAGLAADWAKLTGDDGPARRLKESAPESFVLQTTPDRLLILGRDPNGVSHGIYTVLRDLGCRWYFLTDEWEVIPERRDIAFRADRVEGPALRMRVLSNGAGAGPSRQMLEDWSRRNRLGSAYGPKTIHHSYANYVPNDLFKERPELFAWVSKDGESRGTFQNGLQPCTTHPEVVKMFIDRALADLRARKEATGQAPPLISVSPNDGTGDMCRCERCMATGNYGDCALLLANQVAEATQGEFPDTLVGFLAYGRPSALPEKVKEAHPNVVAGIATNFNWKNSVQRLLHEWPKIVRQAIVREYYAIMKWGSQRPDNTMPNIEFISQSLRDWTGKGIDGVNSEMANDWASCGHRFWAFSEMAWNPAIEPGAVADDFYTNCWGPAADPMKRYYNRWETGQKASPRVLRLAFADLEEAAALADSPEVARRIDQLSLYLYWHLLKQAYTAEKDEDKKDRLAIEGDLFQYRWRNSFMVQLPIAIFGVHRTAPQDFTSEEVAELRREAVTRFLAPTEGEGSADLREEFSSDLVLLGGGGAPVAAAEDAPLLMTNASYLFRADAGEKVEVLFRGSSEDAGTGTEASRNQDPDESGDPIGAEILSAAPTARFQVWFLGPDGKAQEFVEEIMPPTVPAEGCAVSFVAARAGLYRIDARMVKKTGGVAADFGPRPHVLAAHLNPRKQYHQPLRAGRAGVADPAVAGEASSVYYFYVPQGTKEFLVEATPSIRREPVNITMSDAGGEFITAVTADARAECLVPVPPGRDGAVWQMRLEGDQGRIGLGGIPPWLATDPGHLLVPREWAAAR